MTSVSTYSEKRQWKNPNHDIIRTIFIRQEIIPLNWKKREQFVAYLRITLKIQN